MAEAAEMLAHVTASLGGQTVLADVSATIRHGRILTLIGPNGAGKTTLARVMLGLLRPDRGTVRRKAGLRIGYMPQRLHLDPIMPLTVGRFLGLGVSRPEGGSGRCRAVLAEVGAPADAGRPMSALSGGELQRVLLARALLRDPELLVLDEPTQGVDVTGQAEFYRLIGGIRDARRCGVLLISHDLHLVMAATDHVVCLNQHVCCAGHPEAVTRDPAYLALFGDRVAAAFALYQHHHDHAHADDGRVVPLDGAADDRSAHTHG
jgi:zinc transport system ATP-binding protein